MSSGRPRRSAVETLVARTVKKERRTQAERSEATTGAIVAAAHRLFAAKGFAATSIDDILAAAGATRGALYHHFESKTEIFRAAFEEQEKVLMQAVTRASATKRDSWSAFRAGCEAFLEACLDPAMQRIVLIDAPSAIGWEAMREIEHRYARAVLELGLERAMEDGSIARRPVRPLANFLLGAMSESAMGIARAPDPRATMNDARSELGCVLDGFAAAAAGARPSRPRSGKRTGKTAAPRPRSGPRRKA